LRGAGISQYREGNQLPFVGESMSRNAGVQSACDNAGRRKVFNSSGATFNQDILFNLEEIKTVSSKLHQGSPRHATNIVDRPVVVEPGHVSCAENVRCLLSH
jgi:hypothetical protein